MSRAYYNEIDPGAAAWLRELIAAGLIAPGEVDERSICDVKADDLRGFVQCHWFAGIGGWSYALRLAGWPDERPVWSGSCPCQPLSCAGQRKGHADERHLWPAFYALIAKCRPATVFGEQVASKDGREWLAGIRADLEGAGYAVGGADLCAASVGAPHIRQRLWWVAEHGGVVQSDSAGPQSRQIATEAARHRSATEPTGGSGRIGDTGSSGLQERGSNGRVQPEAVGACARQAVISTGDPWANAIWLPCADGKSRRIESGLEPLVAGLPRGVVPGGDPSEQEVRNTGEARVMRLRGYGNAIVPQVAAEFVRAHPGEEAR